MITSVLTIIAVFFWIFRVVVAISYNMGIGIGIEPLNFTAEIVVLFITLFCLILIVKKNLFGSILYLISYGAYFGIDLYKTISYVMEGNKNIENYTSMLISLIAIIIALLVFASIGLTVKGKTKDGKTDWFFKNKELDRKLDERADKNHYKF